MEEAYYIISSGSLQRVGKDVYQDWFHKVGHHIKLEAPEYGGILHSLKVWYDGRQDGPDWKPFHFKYTEHHNEGPPTEITKMFGSFTEAASEFLNLLTLDTRTYNQEILPDEGGSIPEVIIP